MQTKIQTWGNSLAVRIPKSFAEETHLSPDSLVDLVMKDGGVMITLVPQNPTLEEMLALVTLVNRHTEHDAGPSVGNEVW